MLRTLKSLVFWGGISILLLIGSLGLAWGVCAFWDFGYAWWYELLDMHSFIAEFSQKNVYKKNFELTDFEEHQRLFHDIVIAIHQWGAGLADIHYKTNSGKVLDTLLIEAEIVHLVAVAKLVMTFLITSATSLILGVGLILYAKCKNRQASIAKIHNPFISGREEPIVPHYQFPGLRMVLCNGLGLVACITIAVFLIGPQQVFYQLHLLAFEPDHQWFFYYEYSLMTTLMMAPTLFGAIAAYLLVVTSFIYSLLLWGIKVIIKP